MFDNLIHIHENIGANNIMNNGLKDWKKVVFISYPNKDRSTFLAVNKLNAEPASSKKVQNTVVKKSKTAITHIRCLATISILLAS